MSDVAVKWGPDDPHERVGFVSRHVVRAVSGLTRKDDVVARFCPGGVGETPGSAYVRGRVG